MTTAEKRAELKAQGEPWPDCDCHNTPMLWNKDAAMKAGGRFHCRIERQQNRKAWRQRQQEAGLCVHCSQPAVTDTLCRDHADAHADLMAQPKQKLDHQFTLMRFRQRGREAEGFQPTGVGLAAFAAFTREGKLDG